MDVHRDFCEIAVAEPDGQVHLGGPAVKSG